MGLQYTVHLEDDQGCAHVFGPGDVVPVWARAKITNPLAWDAAGADPADSGAVPAAVGGPPPQTGPGASRQLWVTYAHTNNVVVQDGWKRDDIIAACRQAGVPV